MTDQDYERFRSQQYQEQLLEQQRENRRRNNAQRDEMHTRIAELYEELNDVQNEVELAHRFLRENGLEEKFEEWDSYRRME